MKWSDLSKEETKEMCDKILKEYNSKSESDILTQMKIIGEEEGYDLTPTAEKVAKFRERTGMPISECPCDPGNPYRGCIGTICREEIETTGTCHCHAYKRRDK